MTRFGYQKMLMLTIVRCAAGGLGSTSEILDSLRFFGPVTSESDPCQTW